jgi:MFS family permease
VSTATAERVPLFSSFALHNYRLFWFGGFVSNIGTWMARIAQDWLVLTVLTHNSALALGLITGLQFLPTAVLAPYAGTLADRFDKRRLLMMTQAAMAVTGAILAVLVVGGWVQLWHVFVLATMQGIVAAFDSPARQSFAPEMVPPNLIGNAVGLNSTSFHSARLIGPAVAGLVIGVWGVGPALVINAVSFVAVLVALAMMRASELRPAPRAPKEGGVRAGLRYVRNRPDIMLVMFMVFMLGTFGMNFQVSNAVMATGVFGVGAEQFGLMSSVSAVGAITAGLLAARRTQIPLRLIVGALGAFTVALVLLSISPNYWFYLLVMAPTGFFSLTVMTAANTSVQLATDPVMRGRVMALYMAIFMGGTPIGAPLVGWIGDVLGPRWTLAVGAIACGLAVAVAVLYLLRRRGWEWPWRRNYDEQAYIALPDELR